MQEHDGAKFDLGGLFVSAKAQWNYSTTILTTDSSGDIVPATSFDGQTWQLSLTQCWTSTSPAVTVTTANSTISFNSTTAVLSLEVPSTVITALCGDYDADLISATTAGVVTHHAHGRVTFRSQPRLST